MAPRGELPDPHEVHVWTVELTPARAAVEQCFAVLSADERDRAARFCFEHLRDAFTLSRGILRVLAGRYLGAGPECIAFAYAEQGKPRLASPESPLAFNLAHSGCFAVYAFATGCDVGVDIERIRAMSDQEGIVRRFFSAEEGAEWLALDEAQRAPAFFRCWTRKEAYIKAVGDGLAMPLGGFRVSFAPGAPAQLLHAAGGPATVNQWSMHNLPAPEGYAAALALPDPRAIVRVSPPLTAEAVLALCAE